MYFDKITQPFSAISVFQFLLIAVFLVFSTKKALSFQLILSISQSKTIEYNALANSFNLFSSMSMYINLPVFNSHANFVLTRIS